MTNTTTDPTTTDDPRPAFADVVALASATIAGVGAHQYGDPTPCDDFDVRTLIAHEIGAMQGLAAAARGEDTSTISGFARGIADTDLHHEWIATVADVDEAWSDPAVLGRDLALSWATLPGPIALRAYIFEVLVHTWDLARATGQSPVFDDAIVVSSLEDIRQMLPADGRGVDDIAFGPIGAVPAEAPAIDRLAAWAGRQP